MIYKTQRKQMDLQTLRFSLRGECYSSLSFWSIISGVA